MEQRDLLQLFRQMAAEIAEKSFDHVDADSVIAELGMDSLAMLELVGSLERELQVRIPDEDLAGVVTVRQLLAAVAQRRAATLTKPSDNRSSEPSAR